MCGPGTQTQKRVCKLADNDHDKCKKRNTIRRISCHEAGNPLPNCPKVLGKWKNVGPCNSENGRSVPCGPGYQSMSRDCLNGTGSNLCLDTDMKKVLTCLEAGTKMPDCPTPYSNIFPVVGIDEFDRYMYCDIFGPTFYKLVFL